MSRLFEYNFDGLVGPTHNYAGLSPGNLASVSHAGQLSDPRAAALQGLSKMRTVHALGGCQAILPPQPRPDLTTLRALGFEGSDASVLEQAARGNGHLLRLCSSASAMWTANAATLAPSTDTRDRRLHITVANLSAMFHRSVEARTTLRVFRRLFQDEARFATHPPLPAGSHFSDEGAANHSRLETAAGVVHILAYGRSAFDPPLGPRSHPRRQTREASEALVRCNKLRDGLALVWRQDRHGIDAGAFHSDVLAVAHGGTLLLHEFAFNNTKGLLERLQQALGDEFRYALATDDELPAADAVGAYPFNSQLIPRADGTLAIVAPSESERCQSVRRFFGRVIASDNPVRAVHYVELNASMNNGGGPACLRLRVPLTNDERAAIRARVFWDEALDAELTAWVKRHYRDRLGFTDLSDPQLLDETRTALDELTRLLELGSVYDFQHN